MSNIFDDLTAEQDRIEAILEGYDAEAWISPSAAKGWTVTDVVLHLAQTEEAVIASAAGQRPAFAARSESTLDELVDDMVCAERAESAIVFERWRAARRAAVKALRDADPQQRLPWVTSPLKPVTLATTRLAEHWTHGLDITGPVGVSFPDTDRLEHIAWLGHRTLGYSFDLIGEQPHEVFCELTSPHGATWTYGSADAASGITGSASAFCRVGAQRLAARDSDLIATGPYGITALRLLRNWAR